MNTALNGGALFEGRFTLILVKREDNCNIFLNVFHAGFKKDSELPKCWLFCTLYTFFVRKDRLQKTVLVL